MINEEWRPVFGYEGLYEVSNLGRIKSLPKYNTKEVRILHPTKNKRNGRYTVMLCLNPLHRKRISVHRIVAIAFVNNPNPEKFKEINHKDENPANNSADNLEWCDRKYNMNYGTLPRRINSGKRKPIEAFDESGVLMKFESIRSAKKYGFDGAGICKSIKHGIRYKGCFWRHKWQ